MRPTQGEIQAGDRFRHDREDSVTETATVVATRVDAFGIPHVRFTVTFALPSGLRKDTVMLAPMESFALDFDADNPGTWASYTWLVALSG